MPSGGTELAGLWGLTMYLSFISRNAQGMHPLNDSTTPRSGYSLAISFPGGVPPFSAGGVTGGFMGGVGYTEHVGNF